MHTKKWIYNHVNIQNLYTHESLEVGVSIENRLSVWMKPRMNPDIQTVEDHKFLQGKVFLGVQTEIYKPDVSQFLLGQPSENSTKFQCE